MRAGLEEKGRVLRGVRDKGRGSWRRAHSKAILLPQVAEGMRAGTLWDCVRDSAEGDGPGLLGVSVGAARESALP